MHQYQPYDWDKVKEGLARMIWGFFKKVVIADRIAIAVDHTFDHSTTLSSWTLLTGAILYSFQIYCDFSGYSDIAIGAAKVMGIGLMENFDEPYGSHSITQFWKRWHISLSSWFRDYVYIPLGGNRRGEKRRKANMLIVFLLSGLWHGANWTFVVWGGLHGMLAAFLPGSRKGKEKSARPEMNETVMTPKDGISKGASISGRLRQILKVYFNFLLVTLLWVFFRSPSLKEALAYLGRIFSFSKGISRLVISNSRSMMQIILDKRNHVAGWLADTHWGDAGDLVSMSYLDDEKKFFAKRDYHFIKPSDTGCRNTALYVWGDSYVKDIPDSAYAATSDYHFGRRGYTDLRYRLDPRKKNILIIETAERFVRPDYLHLFPIFDHVKKEAPVVALSAARSAPISYASLFGIKAGDLFNHDINQNLEYNLFQYSFIDPIRQWKARRIYQFFNRASGDVAVSENGKYLFLKETIASHDLSSSYYPVGQTELSQIMSNFVLIYTHYKKEGFDEVYFSIIPNPATILQPDRYNGLIPTIQQLTARQGIPVIDLYYPFTHDPDPAALYRAGDSHWNNKGLQEWLRIVNGELERRGR